MSESEARAEIGEPCPLSGCSKTVSDGENGHWVAWGEAYHSYHTDSKSVARTWEHRDGLTVVPSTESYMYK